MMDDGDQTDGDETLTPGKAKAEAETVDKPALLERIAAASGVPKPQVRKILDAALTEIAVALDSGATLALPPLGKLRPVRQTEQGGSQIHTLRLRRSPAKATGDDKKVARQNAGAQARAHMKAGAVAGKGAPAGQPVKSPDVTTAHGGAERPKKAAAPPAAKAGKAQAKASTPARKAARMAADDNAADDR